MKSYDKSSVIIISEGCLSFYDNTVLEGLTFYLPSSFEFDYFFCFRGEKIVLNSLVFKLQCAVTECVCNNFFFDIEGKVDMDGCSFFNIHTQSTEYGDIN